MLTDAADGAASSGRRVSGDPSEVALHGEGAPGHTTHTQPRPPQRISLAWRLTRTTGTLWILTLERVRVQLMTAPRKEILEVARHGDGAPGHTTHAHTQPQPPHPPTAPWRPVATTGALLSVDSMKLVVLS